VSYRERNFKKMSNREEKIVQCQIRNQVLNRCQIRNFLHKEQTSEQQLIRAKFGACDRNSFLFYQQMGEGGQS
jgi:hypothetical protein